MLGCVHVVDDDASFRTAMERRLKHAGYEVATYASALDLLVNLPAESIPSCILLDVRIPDLDGPALQKRLLELIVDWLFAKLRNPRTFALVEKIVKSIA